MFSIDEPDVVWSRVRTDDGLVHLAIDDLLAELDGLSTEEPPQRDASFPFVLSAGERRSFTANTILRDPAWRKRDRAGALRIAPADAAQLGIAVGDAVRITTKRGSAVAVVDLDEAMQSGHVSLPNGLGLDFPSEDGSMATTGVAPNDLTSGEDRDWVAGTPWHKHVPARLERVGS
ncbi:MAG: molybdopterin dinucleotide binding domain-containing protein [Ilumatobacteraceae bacterium]